MITVLSQCSAAQSRVQTKTCHEVTAEVKFRNFAREPEFTLSAARSTRATNLWVGSSNKTYVEHDSPSVSERAGVKLIKQSRTNYLLDISRDVNPAAQFSVEAYCVSLPSLLPSSCPQFPSTSPPRPPILCRSPFLLMVLFKCRLVACHPQEYFPNCLLASPLLSRISLLLRQFKGLDELRGGVGMVSLLSPLEVDWPYHHRAV